MFLARRYCNSHGTCALSSVGASSATQRRSFETLKETNDMSVPSLMDILGLKGETDLLQLQRSPQVMRALFRKRAKLLRPDKVPADAARMKALVNAYTFLSSEKNKVNYYLGNKSSIDVNLGIVREGHDVFGNYDPEHQSLDHLLMRGEAESAYDAAEALGTQRTFSDFTSVYKKQTGMDARGVGDDRELPTAAPPQPGEKLRPQKGRDVSFLLKLSFEEGAHGCQKEISYEREKRCVMCRGSGRAGVVHTRCPQCHGRGSTKMRSGSYDMSTMCDYCMGHGKVPPRLCGICKGHCTVLSTDTYVVSVPSASANMTELWVQRKGHDGKRGGVSGNLIVRLMVSEHRIFHTRGLDLHAVLPIPLSVALLGGYVEAPSLTGPKKLYVRPMTTSGDIFTLVGEGIPDHLGGKTRCDNDAGEGEGNESRGPTKGDLKIHAVVVVPSRERLSARQLTAFESLKEIEEKEAEALHASEATAAAQADEELLRGELGGENATRRPSKAIKGEVFGENSPTNSEGMRQKAEQPLPSLRRRSPARASGSSAEETSDVRLRPPPFFTPKLAFAPSSTADRVHVPTLDEMTSLKERYRSWLPVTKAGLE